MDMGDSEPSRVDAGEGTAGDELSVTTDFEEASTISSEKLTTVTMEVTADIADMDPKDREVIHVLADLYEQAFQEVIDKNRDYGFSFLATGAKLAQSSGVPFGDPARAQAFGLLTRSGDKRERLIENVYGDGSQAVSDEPAVTAQEAANYYFFLAFVLSRPDLATEVGTE